MECAATLAKVMTVINHLHPSEGLFPTLCDRISQVWVADTLSEPKTVLSGVLQNFGTGIIYYIPQRLAYLAALKHQLLCRQHQAGLLSHSSLQNDLVRVIHWSKHGTVSPCRQSVNKRTWAKQ